MDTIALTSNLFLIKSSEIFYMGMTKFSGQNKQYAIQTTAWKWLFVQVLVTFKYFVLKEHIFYLVKRWDYGEIWLRQVMM